MITHVFFRVAAEWSVAEALELLDSVRVERVIVHRLEPDAESFYVYRRDDLIRQLRANDRGIVRDALALHERRATPVIAGQLEVEEPAVVVAGGRIVGIALPTTRAISMSRPEVETWYLSTKAPQEIDVGARASLIIELTRDAGVYQELARALELAAGDEVKLVLHAAGAIAIDGRTEATLVVPSRSPETLAAGGPTELFTLHGRSIGTGQVTVYAFRNGQSIASITLVVRVREAVADSEPVGHMVMATGPEAAPPDLAMTIFEDREANAYRMLLNSRDLTLNYAPFGPIKLADNVDEFLKAFYGDIESILESTDSARDKVDQLGVKGTYLAEKVMPKELRDRLWALRTRIKSVQVQSAEPWVPWELCKLMGGAPGATEVGGFLVEEFDVTRWFLGEPQRAKLTMRSIGLVVPAGSGLSAASSEQAYIASLARPPGRVVTAIPPRATDLRAALIGGTHDVLHFTGHGKFDPGNPDRSRLVLEGNRRFTPEDLSGTVTNLGRAHPFVFLNACEIGRAGKALGGMAGWPHAFIRAGAGAFVGPFWAVADTTASLFAQSMYTALLDDRVTVGRAVHVAREAVRMASDPTWLAYVVYAHPDARVDDPDRSTRSGPQ